MLLDHDDTLTKNALIEIVKLLNENKNIDFIYSDEDKIDIDGNHMDAFFKPDWSPDLLLSYNYPIHVSVFRTSILNKIGGFHQGFDGSQDYDLILRYTEETQNIAHIPKVLYSWRKICGSTALHPSEKDYAYMAGKKALQEAIKRRNIDAIVEDGIEYGRYRIKYQIRINPLISIIIPTRNLTNLQTCVESIFEKSSYRKFEIIVLDNSKTNEIKKFCDKHTQISRLDISSWKFNFSKFNNDGVSKSKGEYIIFLNDDTEVIRKDWIESLLEHAQRKDVGIAGAKLLYRDGHVQHAGTVIGIDGFAGNYGGIYKDDGGYFSYANIIRNCSAVTAACMMIRREIFFEVGEYDENMAQAWQDVDLCLRVIKSGKYIVYTPYSLLYHYEGGTRGKKDITVEEENAKRLFRQKHIEYIQKGDTFYSPNLSLVNPFAYVLEFYDPIKVLEYIYSTRRDLQLVFHDDDKYGYRSMIDWEAIHGVTTDNHRDNLIPFHEYYYNHCSKEAKPLAEKIRKYITNPRLREKFPEVMEGKYDRYSEYLQKEAKI
jgi:GT2 family glycosyltransferase